MNKRAQAQIITTVLIILLVLAGIVILWNVVSGTIESGGEQITAQSGCIGVSMEVTRAVAGENKVIIRRGQGEGKIEVTGYKLFVDGTLVAQADDVNFDPLETYEVTGLTALVEGKPVSVAARVGNTICAASANYRVTATS